MTNPYSLPAAFSGLHDRPTASLPGLRFFVNHFVAFQISFVFVWLALICTNTGLAKTVNGFLDNPRDLLIMTGVGIGVWTTHVVFAFIHQPMRRTHATVAAVIGSAFFFVGMQIFETLVDVLPRDMSMKLSWTPVYVYISMYVSLSIISVCVYAHFRVVRAKNGV